MITPEQIRAARSLLGWPARILAERAGIHLTTVQRVERGRGYLRGNIRSIQQIQTTLEEAGVEFLSESRGEKGPGVRLKYYQTSE